MRPIQVVDAAVQARVCVWCRLVASAPWVEPSSRSLAVRLSTRCLGRHAEPAAMPPQSAPAELWLRPRSRSRCAGSRAAATHVAAGRFLWRSVVRRRGLVRDQRRGATSVGRLASICSLLDGMPPPGAALNRALRTVRVIPVRWFRMLPHLSGHARATGTAGVGHVERNANEPITARSSAGSDRCADGRVIGPRGGDRRPRFREGSAPGPIRAAVGACPVLRLAVAFTEIARAIGQQRILGSDCHRISQRNGAR